MIIISVIYQKEKELFKVKHFISKGQNLHRKKNIKLLVLMCR